MILLDTNVVSEPLKLSPDAGVLTWIDAQLVESLYLSTISLAELRFGIAALPAGKRSDTLHTSLDGGMKNIIRTLDISTYSFHREELAGRYLF